MSYTNDIQKTKTYNIVNLADLKDHLNVDSDFVDDDSLILLKSEEAIGLSEDHTGRDIATTVNVLEVFDFDGNILTIDEAPFDGINSIKAYDEDNNETIITDTEYIVRIRKSEFIIKFNDDISYAKIVVNFNTGYDALTLPPSIRSAIFIKVNDLYDMERTSFTVGVNYNNNEAFKNCLAAYVINRW